MEGYDVLIGNHGNSGILTECPIQGWYVKYRRQVKHFTKVSKMSKLWNLVTISGITMRNALN